MDSALTQQAELVYLRQPQLDKKSYAVFVEALLLKSPELATKLVYQFTETLDEYPGAGVHLSQRHSLNLKERPIGREFWFGVSCHNQVEVARAEAQGADFITISPVLPTKTHPELEGIGWEEFKGLALLAKVPVYGLGGLSSEDQINITESGGQGLAGISFWQS